MKTSVSRPRSLPLASAFAAWFGIFLLLPSSSFARFQAGSTRNLVDDNDDPDLKHCQEYDDGTALTALDPISACKADDKCSLINNRCESKKWVKDHPDLERCQGYNKLFDAEAACEVDHSCTQFKNKCTSNEWVEKNCSSQKEVGKCKGADGCRWVEPIFRAEGYCKFLPNCDDAEDRYECIGAVLCTVVDVKILDSNVVHETCVEESIVQRVSPQAIDASCNKLNKDLCGATAGMCKWNSSDKSCKAGDKFSTGEQTGEDIWV